MSKTVTILCTLFIIAHSDVIQARFRRQYTWGVTPYYEVAQYYETQPQQWSSQYQQNNPNYSPYFYGYQHQHSWQSSSANQNVYQSAYNRPSWVAETSGGYATAPPDYNQGSYGRPKYLATMQPKPTLSPVVLERSALFVTQQPEVLKSSTGGKHPTFLERLGVATLPIVPSPTLTTTNESNEEDGREAHKTFDSSERDGLENGDLLPGRSSEGRSVEEESESESMSTSTTEQSTSTSELSVAEKDEIASSEILGTPVAGTSTTNTPEVTETETATEQETKTVMTTTIPTTEAIETTTFTTTSESDTNTSTESTTTTTSAPTTTTIPTTSTTTPIPTTKEVKPVTLLAFQEVTDEMSSTTNVTHPAVDQDTTGGNSNETGEGSGSEDSSRSTFSTGIVGLRSPPLPKPADQENVGLAVVEWTDADNEVRKVLT